MSNFFLLYTVYCKFHVVYNNRKQCSLNNFIVLIIKMYRSIGVNIIIIFFYLAVFIFTSRLFTNRQKLLTYIVIVVIAKNKNSFVKMYFCNFFCRAVGLEHFFDLVCSSDSSNIFTHVKWFLIQVLIQVPKIVNFPCTRACCYTCTQSCSLSIKFNKTFNLWFNLIRFG